MQNQKVLRLFRTRIVIGLVTFMLCAPSLSLGWGPGGHMMVASIAFKRLNPRAKAQVKELLARPINPVEVTAKSKDFVNASHWADDIRSVPSFDHFKIFHFIDHPFSTDGTPLPADQPEPDNIVKALEDNVNILKTSTDKDAQAQALRFIIHFVGDIHQPLHSATKVSAALPGGDRGGNDLSIKVAGIKTNLHSYWDGGLGVFPKGGPAPIYAPPPLNQIPGAVARALRGNPATEPKVRLNEPLNFNGWADESFTLAKSTAYRGMRNGITPSPAYNFRGRKVARQRVAWGGYRLAALLNSIWP